MTEIGKFEWCIICLQFRNWLTVDKLQVCKYCHAPSDLTVDNCNIFEATVKF